MYYQPGQYTGFVRTCDGKFVRTNIPQHDFETLDTNFYRNSNQVLGQMKTFEDFECAGGDARDDAASVKRPARPLDPGRREPTGVLLPGQVNV